MEERQIGVFPDLVPIDPGSFFISAKPQIGVCQVQAPKQLILALRKLQCVLECFTGFLVLALGEQDAAKDVPPLSALVRITDDLASNRFGLLRLADSD